MFDVIWRFQCGWGDITVIYTFTHEVVLTYLLLLLCQDLHRRIDQTRPVPSLEDSQFNYGFNSHYLQKVVSYWRNDFDWRRQVDKLNQYPHFKTNIEGEAAVVTH